MRIVAGKFGSRRLASLRGAKLRPSSDRLRETLFDILQNELQGAFFVDVYAGTGAVGIEALSRGARRVVFIEKHPAAVKLIRANLRALAIGVDAEVLPIDAGRGLEALAARGLAADVIFLDPPYDLLREYERMLGLLDRSALVGSTTRIIFERARRHKLPERFGRLVLLRSVEQGDAALDFYGESGLQP